MASYRKSVFTGSVFWLVFWIILFWPIAIIYYFNKKMYVDEEGKLYKSERSSGNYELTEQDIKERNELLVYALKITGILIIIIAIFYLVFTFII